MSLRKEHPREYRAWKAMKSRCYSPSTTKGTYKTQGILVCPEWVKSFSVFFADMGECPDKYSLDRKDNSKGYYKGNCRWADVSTQVKNRGDFNLLYTYQGKTMVLKDWAKTFGIKYTTLYMRIFRSKLSFEEAIEEQTVQMTYNHQTKTLKEWSDFTGIPYNVIVDRRCKGWEVERILTQPVRIKI